MTRNTKQRELVLNILRTACSHPTADMIYDTARKAIPNISKGTVYRNLKNLTEARLISELDMVGNLSRFEGRRDNHYHFICAR